MSDTKLRSYIDRILRSRAREDDEKANTKEIYKELAGDGYDKTTVGKVVNHLRKDDTKAREESEKFDLYLTAYLGASHVHAREADETPMSHASGQPGGVDPEREDDAASAGADGNTVSQATNDGGRHETASRDSYPVKLGAGDTLDDASEGHSANDVEATDRPAHVTGEQGDGNAPNATPAESVVISASNFRRMSMTPLDPREAGGLKGFGFTVRLDEPEAAMLPQTGNLGVAVRASAGQASVESPENQSMPVVGADEAHAPYHSDNMAGTPLAGAGIDTDRQPITEPETIPPVADPATVVSEAGDGDSTASSPDAVPGATNVTPFRTHNPDTHFLNSKGMPRLHGCLDPDVCAGSHRALCFGCSTRHEGPAYQGGAA